MIILIITILVLVLEIIFTYQGIKNGCKVYIIKLIGGFNILFTTLILLAEILMVMEVK